MFQFSDYGDDGQYAADSQYLLAFLLSTHGKSFWEIAAKTSIERLELSIYRFARSGSHDARGVRPRLLEP